MATRQKVVGVIPARVASTRLPRKLLLAETGQPLIQHTWQAARQAACFDELVVAAEGDELIAAVRAFGGRCEATGEHPSGTDRIAEVIRRSFPDCDIVVNIQGDEPEVDARHLEQLVELLDACPGAVMSTLATPIRTREVLDSPSCVKVVRGGDGRALYFSRSTIPHCRDGNPDALLAGETPWLLHLGLYAYRRDFLENLTRQPVSPLEKLEKLEQLRALELGARIQVGVVEHPAVGIDTPEDYARFVTRWRNQSGQKR
ncbi:MAG TPA: 3-deoxy-manno-octulosonate cytidylyltransferase [Planctomycetaceae bacterium]|jgi:3-deoxy-manno-octulosonate cytidylyltransferase (CMP-KDO synthetase)|nr:3-deoxy-manno-octulosonate cytidylyltransferase [Planctomycetaceae bacterium]